MAEPKKRKVGWGFVENVSRKAHFFGEDGRSLCGGFAKFTDTFLELGNDNSPDNCAMCKRKLRATNAKAERQRGDLHVQKT